MANDTNPESGPSLSRAFARKVRLSKFALFFERLWPRLWLLIGLFLLFAVLSFLGVWNRIGEELHLALLGAFGIAAAAALVFAARAPWPGREEAIRRIE